ncbi:MAG: malto-oligosyltrehalose synthase, partial [Lapillicoccus sp.]
IEDTAFYRWHRLSSLNEVGGDPEHFGVSPEELMAFVVRTAGTWPLTMTTLTTHDTKRAEDVRARLAVLSERPDAWHAWLRTAQELARPYRSAPLDGATEYLLWQTVVGAWPLTPDRLQGYATKAVREAKLHTGWTQVDETYEAAVAAFVSGVFSDPDLAAHVERWLDDTASATRAVVLGQKLLQLVLPGVPDVYQGTEVVDLTLVDPDNRRPVHVADLSARLARVDAGGASDDDLDRLDDEKLLVTSRALRLRREHPEWFVGPEATVSHVPTDDEHAFAVARGDHTGDHVVAVVTRLPSSLDGWADATVAVPAGTWSDVLSGATHTSAGTLPIGAVLATRPVSLLVRTLV